MFESLKHWLESIREESRLFEHEDDEVLHRALASLLYHCIALEQHDDSTEKREFDRLIKALGRLISSDEYGGDLEKREFDRVMEQQFDLNQQQIDKLYQVAKSATGDLHEDLLTIRSHLKNNPAVRLRFMDMLAQFIEIHGTHPAELDLFYEALHEVFPELEDPGTIRD